MAKCYTFFFDCKLMKKIGTNVLFVTYLIKNEKKMARMFDICVFFCFFAFENY